jgi:hypothetical protein
MDFELAAALYYNYYKYKEHSFLTKRIKHSDISSLINKLDNKIFQVSKQGESYSGRDIKLITIGNGRKKIFMWSQMHGDESTATMAIFDIFNFLSDKDEFNSIRHKIFDNTTLYFLPMVNPDGAEYFRRGNFLDIDINRDASRMQSPEGKILWNTNDAINADFGFNLHDQNTRYTAGKTYKTAAISFLAPLFDDKATINKTRGNAIKVISGLTRILNKYIPGHIAKYEEDYEPRSFGDTFQGLGMSTILIESGGWKNDKEKQYIRKLNFILLLSAINCIINNDYNDESFEVYNNLPFNKESLYDLILRNLKFKNRNITSIIDLGINNDETFDEISGEIKITPTIQEVGDLSNLYGSDEIDLMGYEAELNNSEQRIGEIPNLQIKRNGEIRYVIDNGILINPHLN